MFSLNDMGLWFWQQLERPVTKSELLETMLEEYEVDGETASAEIDRSSPTSSSGAWRSRI